MCSSDLLGIEESGWTRFWRWVAGSQRADALYRPFAVAVSREGVVAAREAAKLLVA